MVFLILFALLGTVLGQSQLAAITYLDAGTCNLDSEVNVELWVNSASNIFGISNMVVNTDTTLTMKKLTLTEVETTKLIITKGGKEPLELDYDKIKKLIDLL